MADWIFRQRLNTEVTPGNVVYIGNGEALIVCKSGKVYRTLDYGVEWQELADINPSHHQKMSNLCMLGDTGKWGVVFGEHIVATAKTYVDFYISTDRGCIWTKIQIHYSQYMYHIGGCWLLKYLGNDHLYATTGGYYGGDYRGWWFTSDDLGVSWTGHISPDIRRYHKAFLNLGSGVCLIGIYRNGTYDTCIYKSTNYASSLGALVFGQDGLGDVRAFCDMGSSVILAGIDKRIYRSTDSGDNWTFIDTISSTGNITCLTKLRDNIVYAGTSDGYFHRSLDNGLTWTDMGQVESEEDTYSLEGATSQQLIGAFTNARMYTYLHLSAPEAPSGLLCEGLTNPTKVIDPLPEFSAIFNHIDDRQYADYCRIQVATDDAFTTIVWDSDKIAIDTVQTDSRCSDIEYEGDELVLDGSKYYWRIKFWIGNTEGDWSYP